MLVRPMIDVKCSHVGPLDISNLINRQHMSDGDARIAGQQLIEPIYTNAMGTLHMPKSSGAPSGHYSNEGFIILSYN